MTEEKQWLRQLRKGDREALGLIYQRFKDNLLTVGICLTGDRASAARYPPGCLHARDCAATWPRSGERGHATHSTDDGAFADHDSADHAARAARPRLARRAAPPAFAADHQRRHGLPRLAEFAIPGQEAGHAPQT